MSVQILLSSQQTKAGLHIVFLNSHRSHDSVVPLPTQPPPPPLLRQVPAVPPSVTTICLTCAHGSACSWHQTTTRVKVALVALTCYRHPYTNPLRPVCMHTCTQTQSTSDTTSNQCKQSLRIAAVSHSRTLYL